MSIGTICTKHKAAKKGQKTEDRRQKRTRRKKKKKDFEMRNGERKKEGESNRSPTFSQGRERAGKAGIAGMAAGGNGWVGDARATQSWTRQMRAAGGAHVWFPVPPSRRETWPPGDVTDARAARPGDRTRQRRRRGRWRQRRRQTQGSQRQRQGSRRKRRRG